MALSTRVFDVEDALLALLLGIEALGDYESEADAAKVDVGTPGDRRDRHIWIDGDHEVTQTHAVSGGQQEVSGVVTPAMNEKQESFEVHIRVFRRAAVATYAEVRDLARADAAAVESAIAADPTLGGLCTSALVGGLVVGEWWPDETTRACGVELTVHCETVVR